MSAKKEILFEIYADDGKKVLIYGERVMHQIRVHAIDKEAGDVDLGSIEDVWRKLDNADAELRHIRDILNLSESADLPKTISKIKGNIETLTLLVGRQKDGKDK